MMPVDSPGPVLTSSVTDARAKVREELGAARGAQSQSRRLKITYRLTQTMPIKPITALRREGGDPMRKGRPWSLPLEYRVLLVAASWRTNLTLQLAPLFGISKSAADRIIDHLGPLLALQPRRRFRRDTVLIVDGTLVLTRDHQVAEAT